jgi:hypothetical protein
MIIALTDGTLVPEAFEKTQQAVSLVDGYQHFTQVFGDLFFSIVFLLG